MGTVPPPTHPVRAEQMDRHQQQPESPRAKTGVEDRASGLLLRQAVLQTNLFRLRSRVLPNDLKGHSLEDLVGRRGRLTRLSGDKELHYVQAIMYRLLQRSSCQQPVQPPWRVRGAA